jgi:hypothetical protein
MAAHHGIEELLADFVTLSLAHPPPPALNPLQRDDERTPVGSRHSSRRYVDPNLYNPRSSSTRSTPSPLQAPLRDHSGGTRRQNIFRPSTTPSEGSVSSASGCAVRPQNEIESGAATAATSSLALSTSAAPSLSMSTNHHDVGITAPPVASASPHVVVVPAGVRGHLEAGATRDGQSADTFLLPFGDLGNFAPPAPPPPLSPVHIDYSGAGGAQFSDDDDSNDDVDCEDDDDDQRDDDTHAFRTLQEQSPRGHNDMQRKDQRRFELILMFIASEHRSRRAVEEFEFSERNHVRHEVLNSTRAPTLATAAISMTTHLLHDQKEVIQSLVGHLSTVLRSVDALQHQNNHHAVACCASHERVVHQQHEQMIRKCLHICHDESCGRQRVCQSMHEAFSDMVAELHRTIVSRLRCNATDAVDAAAAAAAGSPTLLANSASIRQHVDDEMQRMSMDLAVQLADAKATFEAQLRHQHDVEHRAYRNEIDEKLSVRLKAEIQLREEIARLKCLLAGAYGTIDPPNMPSLDQELHQLPSFHAKVQQEVERTLRASTSTANQSSVYVAQREELFREGAVYQPSLTEMPSFFAPADVAVFGTRTDEGAARLGPTQTDRDCPQLPPDAPLSPETENLVNFCWSN